MGFTVFRTVMSVLICLFLLALFWFPSQYLARVSTDMQTEIERASEAISAEEYSAALSSCSTLLRLYEQHEKKLERFLSHACIDDFGRALAVSYAALTVGDANAALEALAEADALLVRIRGIELFSPNSLLCFSEFFALMIVSARRV